MDIILIMANTAAAIGAKLQTDHAEDDLDEDLYYLRKSDAKIHCYQLYQKTKTICPYGVHWNSYEPAVVWTEETT